MVYLEHNATVEPINVHEMQKPLCTISRVAKGEEC